MLLLLLLLRRLRRLRRHRRMVTMRHPHRPRCSRASSHDRQRGGGRTTPLPLPLPADAAADAAGEEDRVIGNSRESIVRVQTPDGRRIGVRAAGGRRRLRLGGAGGGHDDNIRYDVREIIWKISFPEILWYVYNLSLSLRSLGYISREEGTIILLYLVVNNSLYYYSRRRREDPLLLIVVVTFVSILLRHFCLAPSVPSILAAAPRPPRPEKDTTAYSKSVESFLALSK